MARRHFYLELRKQAVMPALAWGKLIGVFEGTPDILDGNGNLVTPGTAPLVLGTSDLRQNTFQPRHNLNIPFDKVIYEANFNDPDISILRIRQFLAAAAGVALATITATTSFITFLSKPSLVVNFKFNGTSEFLLVLFGCAADGGAVDWRADSLPEVDAYITQNTLEWNGVP